MGQKVQDLDKIVIQSSGLQCSDALNEVDFQIGL